MPEVKPFDHPHHVHLVGVDHPAGFVDGYPTVEEAEANAADRNKRAEKLGVLARYDVIAKP